MDHVVVEVAQEEVLQQQQLPTLLINKENLVIEMRLKLVNKKSNLMIKKVTTLKMHPTNARTTTILVEEAPTITKEVVMIKDKTITTPLKRVVFLAEEAKANKTTQKHINLLTTTTEEETLVDLPLNTPP